MGQGSRISPDLLNRLPATVEEERGRKWISTAEQQRKHNTLKKKKKSPDGDVLCLSCIHRIHTNYIYN